MGMDYQYMGSSSYSRFDRELCDVVEILGGRKTEYLKNKKEKEIDGSLDYWFGFYSSDGTQNEKFVFPENTNKTLVRWANNIYNDFTPEETEEIWDIVKEYPAIERISLQLFRELETLVELGEGWHIG